MRRLMVAVVLSMAGVLGLSVLEVGGVAGLGAAPPAAAAPAASSSRLLAPLPGWKPRLGPIFNDPGRKGSKAIMARLIKAIRHTQHGETIRIATYSFDLSAVANALRRAHKRRGVNVQLIVNRRTASGVVWSLQRTLGKNPRRKNFVVTCPGRCRAKGDGGNQHLKVFSFSRTGGVRDLIIGSSGNLTTKAVGRQWNDSWTIAYDTGAYDAWVKMFNQMKLQKQVGKRYITFAQANVSDPYAVTFQRDTVEEPTARAASSDPVVRRLNDVGCRTRSGYGNAAGQTVVRITQYAVFGNRGENVAKAIARLKTSGCDVRVIGSVFSSSVIKILQRAGVKVRMADWLFAQRDPAKEDGLKGWGPRFYSHFKTMIVSGSWQQKPVKMVWTGSENWSGISFANEEVVVRYDNPGYYAAYLRQFRKMWNGRATHRAGIQPTYGP